MFAGADDLHLIYRQSVPRVLIYLIESVGLEKYTSMAAFIDLLTS